MARTAAAEWLVEQYDDDAIQGFGLLADLIFALVATDEAEETVAFARDELEQLVGEGQGDGPQPSVGELAKTALGIAVAGGDPDDVDGNSLIVPLRSRIVDAGPDAGRIGDAGPFIQALGVFALAATPEGAPEETLTWLADQACADGGYAFVIGQDDAGISQGCPAGTESEADTTALVAQALLLGPDVSSDADAAVQWLLDAQATDGGVDGTANDTGLAGQTLLAAGEDEAARAAAGFIVSLQYDADQPEAGAIRFTPEADGSLLLATTQGVLGLGGPSFPELVGADLAPTPSPSPTPSPAPTPSPTPSAVDRVAGETRITTAIAASQAEFDDDEAGGVVLARADAFADALAGTPLAAELDGPLLITGSDGLDEQVAAELRRIMPDDGTVTLLGGTAALSEQVAADIEALALTPRRIAGDTRITTAIAVAESLPDTTTVLLTTGNDFPDALTAGTAAAVTGSTAVLLTPGDQPSAAVDAFLAEAAPAGTFAIGGPAVAAYPDAVPLAGPSRETTAIAVAREFFDAPAAVALARSDGFADALAGGVLAARRGAPLLLTPTAALSSADREYVCATSSISGAVLLGGTGAVSLEVEQTVEDLLAGSGCP